MKEKYKLEKKKGSVWTHRKGEISPVVLENMLSPVAQTTVIENILAIPIEYRSTYDHVCVQAYFRFKFGIKLKREEFRNMTYQKYQELVNPVQVCADSFDDNENSSTEDIANIRIPTIFEIRQMGMEWVREYLQIFFKYDYPDWETNLRFHSADKFVESTKNFMEINELTIAHIKAYKELI